MYAQSSSRGSSLGSVHIHSQVITTAQTTASSLPAHLSVVLVSGLGSEDEASGEGRPDIQLLLASTGSQFVAVGGRAAGACISCDAIWALVY